MPLPIGAEIRPREGHLAFIDLRFQILGRLVQQILAGAPVLLQLVEHVPKEGVHGAHLLEVGVGEGVVELLEGDGVELVLTEGLLDVRVIEL